MNTYLKCIDAFQSPILVWNLKFLVKRKIKLALYKNMLNHLEFQYAVLCAEDIVLTCTMEIRVYVG